jgi:membrane protein YqaA with SNARE-associated domain
VKGGSGVAVESTASIEVTTTCSLTRGQCPDPGIHAAPFIWRDLVDGAPPRRRARGAGVHYTYHTTEHGPDVRITHVTQVRVDPGPDVESVMDDIIIVEERVYVQRRALQELIDREKAFSDHLAIRLRAKLGKSVARQRAGIQALRAAWLIAALAWIVKIEAKVGLASIRGLRAMLRSLVHIPDVILARSASAQTHLSSRSTRRGVWKGLRDPSGASADEKGVLVVVAAALLIGTVLLLNTVFALILPSLAPEYKHILNDALYNFGAVFLPLPLPPEAILITSALALGVGIGWIGLFLGKLVGSWILFLVGDSLHDSLKRQTAKSPRLKRVVEWLQARAATQGFAWVFFLSAVPFLPDTLILAFAVSGMRFRPFLGAVALGTVIKFGAIVAALLIVGPEVVEGWLEVVAHALNPFNWFG